MKLLAKEEATRTGKLDSEEYRISNQIRFACAFESKADRDAYFEMVADRDGKEYAETLRAKALEHWKQTKGKK